MEEKYGETIMEERKILTPQSVQQDLDALGQYKTADVDRLIRRYVKEQADAAPLREHILTEQQFHRIYYYVNLQQIKDVAARMAFIHNNLLFTDWWHLGVCHNVRVYSAENQTKQRKTEDQA